MDNLKIQPVGNIRKYTEVTQAVKDNEGYCPCALIKNQDTKCPCKEFRNQDCEGECHCGRFTKVR